MKKKRYEISVFLLVFLIWSIYGNNVSAAKCTQGEHEFDVHVVEYAQGDSAGIREYVCIHCGYSYEEEIPRTGHHYGEYRIVQEATCAQEGLKVRECLDCGIEDSDIIPFREEHSFGDWKQEKEQTCSQDGLQQRFCELCGYAEQQTAAATGVHEYKEAAREATCTKEGEKVYTCSFCGDVYREEIKATGHKWGEKFVKREPTYDEEGLVWQVCEHDETHIIEEAIAVLERPETETDAPLPVEPEEKEPLFNELDAVLGVANVGTFSFFFFLIRRDQYVINWDKRKKALLDMQEDVK